MTLPLSFRPLRVRISILVVFTLSVVLTQIPLLNYLGYEFSLAMALSMCGVTGFLTIGEYRSGLSNVAAVTAGDFIEFQKRNLLLHLVLLIVPLFLITFNMIVVKNCSYGEGLGFYLLLPVVTTLFCLALAGFCCVLFRRPRLWYGVVVLAIVGHIFWLGYFSPQIYSYNFIPGYFPGLSYDEVLTITPTLVLFRTVTLVTAAFFFLLSLLIVETSSAHEAVVARVVKLVNHVRQGWSMRKFLLLAAGVLMMTAWIFRVELGFESSHGMIERTLDRVLHTDHFTIRYSAHSLTDDEIGWIADEHEFRFHQVATKLQVPFEGTITSYIYPTDEVMRRSTGVARTNFVKPWRREMHLNKDTWEQSLKHELVHILAGEFGMPVIRAHYNIGLVEGLAMAVEWDFGNRTLHEYAASMDRFVREVEVARLFTVTGFAVEAPTVSYVTSGSFCRFLADRYGLVRLKEVYGGRSFSEVYGKNAGSLVGEWKDFLKRVPVERGWEPHARFYFNRKPIFAKECARQIARLNEQGDAAFRGNNPEGALEFFGASLRESWNTGAFSGFIRAAYQTSRYDTVTHLVEGQLGENFYDVANVLLLYGDAQWMNGNRLGAKTAYEDALLVDLSDGFSEAATLRLVAFDHPFLRTALRTFFVNRGTEGEKLVLIEKAMEESDHPLLHLLAAQEWYRLRDYAKALQSLESSEGVPGGARVLHLREKLRGLCNFYLRRYQDARLHFWQAMNHTRNEASILRLHEWLDRCEWYEERGKSKK